MSFSDIWKLFRKKLKETSGYTLPYVLMILAILSLLIPVILNMISTRQKTDQQRIYQKQAIYLAESAVEDYIQYLKTFNQVPDQAQLTTGYPTGYPGYALNPVTITFPEGKAQYTLNVVGGPSTQYQYTLTVNATVGSQSKTIKYTFSADPQSGAVTDSSNDILLEPNGGSNVTTYPLFPYKNGRTDWNYYQDFSATIPKQFDFPTGSQTWTSFDDIASNATLINQFAGSTVTINLTPKGDLYLKKDYDFQSMFPNKNLVVYVAGNPLSNDVFIDDSFKMNGMLIIGGDLWNTGNGKNNGIILGQSNSNGNSPGNLLVGGGYILDSGSFTNVTGTISASAIADLHGKSGHLTATGNSSSYNYSSDFSTIGSGSWSPSLSRQQ